MTLNELLEKAKKKLEGVHPVVKEKALKLVENSYKRGVCIAITQGYRSIEEQNELYAQGRTKPGKIVTNAKGGDSYHNYGLAIDFCLIINDKQYVWDIDGDFDGDKKADWMEVVEEAKKLGFEWGGDFKRFKDYPHFQYTFGLSIADLKAGKRPPQTQPDLVATANKSSSLAKKYTSVVDYLKDHGMPYDFASRVKLAEKMGIPHYNGHPDQNIKMLELLQKQSKGR